MYALNFCPFCMQEYFDLLIMKIDEAHFGISLDGIITCFSTLFVGILAAIYYYISEKRIQRYELSHMLDTLIKISITYPYLEDKHFIAEWNPDIHDSKSCRYDNFCCMVFNFLERLWLFYGGNQDKMKKIVAYREYIVDHSKWWKAFHDENEKGYDKEFILFVDQIILSAE